MAVGHENMIIEAVQRQAMTVDKDVRQILAISVAGELFVDLFGQDFESLRHLNGITLC